MDTSKIEKETKNLLLKSISLDYKEEMFREFTPEITHYMLPNSPENIRDTVKFIKEAMSKNKKGTDWFTVILDKKTKEFFGCAGIHDIHTKTPEPGIWIKKSAHGNKYGREAVTGLKDWADENLDYDYLVYPVAVKNYSSRKIPESLGGKIVKEYFKEKEDGTKQKELEYRIYS